MKEWKVQNTTASEGRSCTKFSDNRYIETSCSWRLHLNEEEEIIRGFVYRTDSVEKEKLQKRLRVGQGNCRNKVHESERGWDPDASRMGGFCGKNRPFDPLCITCTYMQSAEAVRTPGGYRFCGRKMSIPIRYTTITDVSWDNRLGMRQEETLEADKRLESSKYLCKWGKEIKMQWIFQTSLNGQLIFKVIRVRWGHLAW